MRDKEPMKIDFGASPNLLGSRTKGTFGKRDHKARGRAERVLRELYQRIDSINAVLVGRGPAGFPVPGEIIRVVTFADITSLGIIMRAVDELDDVELFGSVYSMNQRAIYVFRQLLESGKLKGMFLLCSDTLLFRSPARIREMRQLMADIPDRCRYTLADTHAKVFCIEGSVDGQRQHITISGSANLSSNAKIEDYVIANSEGAHAHYRSWIDEVGCPIPPPDESDG